MKTKDVSKKSGFTLIEIIAVLLILSVLAAVAIPRYMSMVDEARERSLDGALSAAYSQLSLVYAQEALREGRAPTVGEVVDAINANDNALHPAGDFEYAFVAGAGVVDVTVNKEGDTTEKEGEWPMPE